MNIAEIIPKENYMLYVKDENGKSGLFDVKPYFDLEAFKPLTPMTGVGHKEA